MTDTDYSPRDDFARSYEECLREVRERKAAGGSGWQPKEQFLNGKVTLHCGDCREVLAQLDECSIDSCVTDPPYHLTSIVKRFGGENAAPAQFGADGRYSRLSGGFMGSKWDAPDAPAIDPGFAYWMAGFIDGEGCFSVHKKQVNGCETYDCQFSMQLRDDDANIVVEMQRQLGGIGSIARRPAPKDSGNAKPQVRYCISSQRDCQKLREVLRVFPLRAKKARDFEIWSHALDAWIAHEPGDWQDMAYFRKALMDVRQYGAGFHPSQLWAYRWAREVYRVLKPGAHILAFGGTRTFHRLACAIEDAGFEIRDTCAFLYGSGFPKSHSLRDIDRPELGTALKPAMEMICMARKPLSEGTVAANVLEWGTGAINVDGCRVGTDEDIGESRHNVSLGSASGGIYGAAGGFTSRPHTAGRWPANVILDGSEEVTAAFPETGQAAETTRATNSSSWKNAGTNGVYHIGHGDSGSAARYFYSAKADAMDRIGSSHPTIKPVDLMQYLMRLVTPKGGTVLDPFAGTGTTGEAAFREGMRAVLIEREAAYCADIRRRMALVMAGPDERARESMKEKLKDKPRDDGPLFSGIMQEEAAK